MLNMTTARTSFRGWIPTVNEMDKLILAFGNPLKNIAEFGKSNVAHLASPKTFHRFDVERFQNDNIKAIGEVMSKLVKPISSLISNAFVDSIKRVFRFLPVGRTSNFAGKLTVSLADFGQVRLEKLSRFDFFPIRQCEKGF